MNIIDGKKAGLWFDLSKPGARLRKGEPSVIVLHHTAGEGGAQQVYRTLKGRGLGIHFVVDNKGAVTQMADFKKVVTSHAGSMNEHSIGIEISNRGIPPWMLAAPRETYTHNFRGKDREFLKFYPEQVLAVWELLNYLHAETGIPLSFPASQNVLPKAELADYKGVLGHHHLVLTKIDPSPHLWDALRAYSEQK